MKSACVGVLSIIEEPVSITSHPFI